MTPVKGIVTVNLYAVTAGEVATAGTLVGTAKRGGKLAGNKSAKVTVMLRRTALPAGSYTLVPVVVDPSRERSIGTTGPTITVAAAYVDLAATLSAMPTTLAIGKTLTLTLIVINSGNVNSTGLARVAVYLSIDGLALSIPVTTVKVSPTVKATRSIKLKLRVKVPAAAAALNLYPLAVFIQGTAPPATAVAPATIYVS